MESKSTSCVIASLAVAFVVMLLIAVGAWALLHSGGDAQKSLAVPGTDLNGITVVVWGLVAGAGAAAQTGAPYLLTHLHR